MISRTRTKSGKYANTSVLFKNRHFSSIYGKKMIILIILILISCTVAVQAGISISTSPVVISKGTLLTISGNADSDQDYELWIIGNGFLEKKRIFPESGSYSYNMTPDVTSGLMSGQYFAVIQGNGYNSVFDVGNETEDAGDVFPQNAMNFFNDLENPASDDPYAKTTFIVEEPWIKYETVATSEDGTDVYVLATTNLRPGGYVGYSLVDTADGEEVLKGGAEVLKGADRNYFEITFPKTDLNKGEYVLQSFQENVSKSVLNQAVVIPIGAGTPPAKTSMEIEEIKVNFSLNFFPEVQVLNNSWTKPSVTGAEIIYNGYDTEVPTSGAGIDGDRIYWITCSEDKNLLFVHNITTGEDKDYDLGNGLINSQGIRMSGNQAFYGVQGTNPVKEDHELVAIDLDSGEKTILETSKYPFYGYDVYHGREVWIKRIDPEKVDLVISGSPYGDKKTIAEFSLSRNLPVGMLMDDKFVVWRECNGSGGFDSYFAYDIDNDKISTIPLSFGHSSISDLKNGIVTGRYPLETGYDADSEELNRTGTPYGIYLYSLEDGTESRITETKSNKQDPVFSGNSLLWSEKTNGHYEIFLYDLNGTRPIQLTKGIFDCYDVSADDGYLVWCESATDISYENSYEPNVVLMDQIDEMIAESDSRAGRP